MPIKVPVPKDGPADGVIDAVTSHLGEICVPKEDPPKPRPDPRDCKDPKNHNADWCKPDHGDKKCKHGEWWDKHEKKCKHDDKKKDHDKDKDKDKHHEKDNDKDTVTHEDDDNGEYTQVKDVPVGAVKTGDGSSL